MQTHANQAFHTFVVAVLVLLITSSLAIYLTNWSDGGLIYLVFMAGTSGGVANNFRRLQRLSREAPAPTDAVTQRLLTLQIYLSPVVGGVFGTVLYGVFLSGLLQGSLFPEPQGGEELFSGTRALADKLVPRTNADAAKALIWSFIAGFAEQFVPNFIDKIAAEAAARHAREAENDADEEPRNNDTAQPQV